MLELTIENYKNLFSNPEGVFRFLSSVFLIIAVVIFNHGRARYDADELMKYREHSIRDIAKRDLSMVGNTSWSCVVSLEQWLFSILAINYRQHDKSDVMHIIREWAPMGISSELQFDVEAPYSRFLKIIDDAREKEQTPVFNVSSEYDYHNLSKTLKYNDFVDCESLLVKIDAFTGVTNND